MWDLNGSGCIAKGDIPAPRPSSIGLSYDPTGLIFAVCVSSPPSSSEIQTSQFGNSTLATLKLFDRKDVTSAFATFKVEKLDVEKFLRDGGVKEDDAKAYAELARVKTIPESSSSSSSSSSYSNVGRKAIEFSADGSSILLKCGSGIVLLLDAFTGAINNAFVNHVSTTSSSFSPSAYANVPSSLVPPAIAVASFSRDGDCVLVAGVADNAGKIYNYDTAAAAVGSDGGLSRPVQVWDAHAGPVRGIEVCKGRECFVSVCKYLVLWGKG